MPTKRPLTLGQRIRRQRMYLGLTQQQLAKQIPVDQTAVAKWELDRSVPHVGKRHRIAEVLGLHYFTLFVEEEDAA